MEWVIPLWVGGETARAERVAREAVALSESGPPALRARAYSELAGRLMLAGNFEECVLWTERALDISGRAGLTEVTARALQFRGSVRCSSVMSRRGSATCATR